MEERLGVVEGGENYGLNVLYESKNKLRNLIRERLVLSYRKRTYQISDKDD